MKKDKIDYTYFFNKSMETDVGMAAWLHNFPFGVKKREATPEACFPN